MKWIIDPGLLFLMVMGTIGIGGCLLGWLYERKCERDQFKVSPPRGDE